jgi:thymidylate synthase (FAD)
MKVIKPYFEIIEQQPQEVGMLKHIETCGRVAWKSEDKITEDSYIKFVEMLKGVNHGSVLEHGTVYLIQRVFSNKNDKLYLDKYSLNNYSKTVSLYLPMKSERLVAVTTNYRVLVENNWLDDLIYQCEPTDFHEKRVTVKFTCDRSVSHEFVRHRVFSFTQESTRYCNYSKNKFNNELTFIEPIWMRNIEEETSLYFTNCYEEFYSALENAESSYFNLLDKGWKPQQARTVLPNSLKTELMMTGFVSDWKHFFHLRCSESAHPQARELAIPLREKFKELKLL